MPELSWPRTLLSVVACPAALLREEVPRITVLFRTLLEGVVLCVFFDSFSGTYETSAISSSP
ncbi:MAG: hypothetical protein ACKO20_01700 [Actinomycetota bacterium]